MPKKNIFGLVVLGLIAVFFVVNFVLTYLSTQHPQEIRSQASGDSVITLTAGTNLLIDDYLIANKTGVTRIVNKPYRYWCNSGTAYRDFKTAYGTCNPVVSNSPEFRANQPFMSVIKDGAGYKMWYNAGKSDAELSITPTPIAGGLPAAYVTSSDGIRWTATNPLTRNKLFGQTYVFNILDEGAGYTPASERYKQIYSSILNKHLIDQDWLLSKTATSPDGIEWTPNPSITTLIPGYGRKGKDGGNQGDILELYKNPLNNKYGFFNRYFDPYTWQSKDWSSKKTYTIRRVGYMISDDFKTWKNPLTGVLWSNAVLFAPDGQDYGVTEWYGGPTDVRNFGGLLVGFLKVLRDDLSAPGIPDEVFHIKTATDQTGTGSLGGGAEKGGAGVGYTVLAWSRDNGMTWQRDRASMQYIIPGSERTVYGINTRYADLGKINQDPNVFFAPDAKVEAFDHAHAWIDEMVEVGNQYYFYYGGYKYGHKWGDRQIGLAVLTKDRYVYYDAGDAGGSITTPVFRTPATRLFINADAGMGKYTSPGEVQVSIIDATNHVTVCNPITRDQIHAEVICPKSFATFVNQPIQLKFDLTRAALYAFYLENSGTSPTSTPTPTGLPGQPTLTLTPTPSPRPTLSPTPTTQLTSTPTPTTKLTSTPTPTQRPTSTPTLTPTATPTLVPGQPTPTITPTPLATSTPIPSATPVPGICNKSTDLNHDGQTDLFDAADIIASLGKTGSLVEDLNCDQFVDLNDFLLVVEKLGT